MSVCVCYADGHGLSRSFSGKTRWSDVTNEEIACTKTDQGYADLQGSAGTSPVSMTTFLAKHGPRCCGSLARTREGGICPTTPPPTTPPPTTPIPETLAIAKKDTKHFVTMSVTMPLTKDEFDETKKAKFKAAVAKAAGTNQDNVEIVAVTEARRRAGSILVETKVRLESECKSHVSSDQAARCSSVLTSPTLSSLWRNMVPFPMPPLPMMQIRADNAADATKLAGTLGTGDALLNKINTELEVPAPAHACSITCRLCDLENLCAYLLARALS